jgi:hypothetical protein
MVALPTIRRLQNLRPLIGGKDAFILEVLLQDVSVCVRKFGWQVNTQPHRLVPQMIWMVTAIPDR